ncbi:hypothetical protein DL96DRAFT_1528184 [Flagelloscypha sp. PMI_526]|nr:hypothetical protein DL96DRAFT_1528184 [Flagelloscypha sp. PMI_526]
MFSDDDLSTNRHSSIPPSSNTLPHQEFSFPDGNLLVVSSAQSFLVHQGVLARHSTLLASLINDAANRLSNDSSKIPHIEMPHNPLHTLYFLQALYDGLYGVKGDPSNFLRAAPLLLMASEYGVQHIRDQILRTLSSAWPDNLHDWDVREAHATDNDGLYEPRKHFPHPILLINLARKVNAPALLPAAFYDLSRSSPSDIANGYFCSITQQHHYLTELDLLNALKGREQGSRFLSTFIVSELEGREPMNNCIFKHDLDSHRRRACQTAFEAVTFEILRDVNGVVCQRSADPLFAILDTELMQTKERPGGPAFRTCEVCRVEFGNVVDHARTELWSRLPDWFGLEEE